MANNAPYSLGPYSNAPRLNAVAVTASGSTTYDPPLTKLYVGTAGSVTLVMAGTGTVTLASVPAGTWVDDVAVYQVTAGSGIIGFF